MESGTYRRRSKIWLAFLPGVSGQEEKATCRICNNVFPPNINYPKDKCTTAKLWKHLSSDHPEVAKMLAGINQDDIMKEGLMENWNLSILQKQSTKGFTSKVWKFFWLDDHDKNISICCECGERVSRGCDRNTTSMWNHIKQKHPIKYATAQREDQEEEEDSSPNAVEKAAVKDQFLLHSARQNSYICKTCGTIMRLESPDEEINASRLSKHLDNIFHKRVQHGLEAPKRPILPKYYANTRKAEKKTSPKAPQHTAKKALPTPALVAKIATGREVDFMHSAMVMQTLYEQQKRDMCCDCTITIPHKQKRVDIDKYPIPGSENDTIECYETSVGFEFKAHSSVMAVVSDRMRALLDNTGSISITLPDISRDSMKRWIEIAYLGKLSNITSLTDSQLSELHVTAQSFGSPSIVQYLERSCPTIYEKLVSEALSGQNSPQNEKASFLEKYEQKAQMSDNNEISTSGVHSDPKVEDTTPPVTTKKSSSSRRKRPPLSTTFRLKVPKTEKAISDNDSDHQSYNGNDDGSPMALGMKFEIQGDTAILRAPADDNHDHFNFIPTT